MSLSIFRCILWFEFYTLYQQFYKCLYWKFHLILKLSLDLDWILF